VTSFVLIIVVEISVDDSFDGNSSTTGLEAFEGIVTFFK
jgi:hypothetical protein